MHEASTFAAIESANSAVVLRPPTGLSRRLYRPRQSSWATLSQVTLISLSATLIWATTTFEWDLHAESRIAGQEKGGPHIQHVVQAAGEADSASHDSRVAIDAFDHRLETTRSANDSFAAAPNAAGLELYLRRARELMSVGDIAAARLMLERAAEGKDGRALAALAETYDPVVLEASGVIGIRPEPERARALYLEALDKGSDSAKRHLDAMDIGNINQLAVHRSPAQSELLPLAEDDPWWVLVASLRDGPGQDLGVERTRARVANCRFEAASDRSAKFHGFRAGYIAVVVGPFPGKPDAARALEAVRPCAPDANLRQARRRTD